MTTTTTQKATPASTASPKTTEDEDKAAKNEDNAGKDKVTITRYIYVGSDCVLEKIDDYGKHCILRRSQSAGSNGKIVNVQRVAFQNAFQTF